MACDHKQLRCTDNRFFCLLCGAEVPNPYKLDKQEGQEEKQAPRRKRKAKGADGNENH